METKELLSGKPVQVANCLFEAMLKQQTMYNIHEARRRALNCAILTVELLHITAITFDTMAVDCETLIAETLGIPKSKIPPMKLAKMEDFWVEVKKHLKNIPL